MALATLPPTRAFTAQDAVGYLIAANGNPKLAAIQAVKDYPGSLPLADHSSTAAEAALLNIIAKEPTALASLGQQISLLAYLQALDAFRVTHLAYMQKLPNLGPRDTAKAYTELLDSLARLRTVAPAQVPDPFETVMRRLPPDVADAVEFFMRKPLQDQSTHGPIQDQSTLDPIQDQSTLDAANPAARLDQATPEPPVL